MNFSRTLLAATLGSMLMASTAMAQGGTITGKVVDSTTNAPIANVNVTVQGTRFGAMTGTDGSYTVTGVPAGAQVVRAARIGYRAKSATVTVANGGRASADFAMAPVAAFLQQIVTTGYGQQRREAVTGAVATVKSSDALVGVQSNANDLLQGRVSGVTMVTNGGEPGAGAQIRIRGTTSISASNEPLYVIDGVPISNAETEAGGIGLGGSASLPRSPLNTLNPADIATITVLKDAAATAIYGSRGANGVILIETKQGSASNQVLEYNGYVAASMSAKKLGLLNGAEYRSFVQSQGSALAAVAGTLGSANTDWENEVLRTAITQNHDLSFSGGTPETKYRASLNYMDNQGIVLNNGFQRFQGRLNATSQRFNGKLLVGVNLAASQTYNQYIPFENTGGFEGGVFTNMVTFNPTQPIRYSGTGSVGRGQPGSPYWEYGTGRQSQRNPIGLINQIADQASTSRILGNVSASYMLLPSLTAQVNVGVDKSGSIRQTYWPNASPAGAEYTGRARQVSRDLASSTFQSVLTWAPKFGSRHETELVGGYEFAKYNISEFGVEARNFLSDAFTFNNLGGGGAPYQQPYSFLQESRLASFFSRANYGFDNKYFLTAVVRRDGSSRFGDRNKWALFPALSAAWKISDEKFMRNSFFSELRLRAGYGTQGNQGVAPYQSLTLLAPDGGARYVFGSTVYTGIVSAQNPNPDLKWETTTQTSVAADFGILNNRVTGTVEYYQKNTSDLLFTVAVPQPAPVSTQLQNIGSMSNKGFEANVDWSIWSKPEKSWTTGFILTVERNKITDLGKGRQFISTGDVSGQGQSGQQSQRLIVGQPVGTFFGPEFVGVNSAGKQLFNDYDATGKKVGTTTSPSNEDFQILGNANPDFAYSWRNQLTLGKFDVNVIFRGQVGGKTFNNTALVYATKGNALQSKNFIKTALTDGIGLTEPAIFSSRYIEDASFLRLQNITVGYTFQMPGTVRRNSARAYVSADNLFLITGYKGYDPEVFAAAGLASRGIDYLSYPRARTFTTGLRLTY